MEVWSSSASCMSPVKHNFPSFSEKAHQLEQPWLPPGFRFHPTDEELVTFYLANKMLNPNFCDRAIAEADLNRIEPWDLPGKAKMGEKEWYFYSARDRKYPTGMRTNRATRAGYWKATGKDREVVSSHRGELMGMKKTLVFYRGRAPKGVKTNWVMHEYRAEVDLIAATMPRMLSKTRGACKDEWVICRVFHKSAGGKKMPLAEIKQSIAMFGGDQLSAQDDNMDVLKPGSTLPGLMELPLAGSYKDSSNWRLSDKPSHSWTPPAYLLTGASAPTTMSHLTNLLNSLPHPSPIEAGKFNPFGMHAQPELQGNASFGMRTFDKYSFSMENSNVSAVSGVDTAELNAVVDVGCAGNQHSNNILMGAFPAAENVAGNSGAHNNVVLQRAAAAEMSARVFEGSRFSLASRATGEERRGGGEVNNMVLRTVEENRDEMRTVFERYMQGSCAGSASGSETVSYKGEGKKGPEGGEEYKCRRCVEGCGSSGCMGLMQEACTTAAELQGVPAMQASMSVNRGIKRGVLSPSLSPQAALSSDYSSSAPPLYNFPSDLESLYWVSS